MFFLIGSDGKRIKRFKHRILSTTSIKYLISHSIFFNKNTLSLPPSKKKNIILYYYHNHWLYNTQTSNANGIYLVVDR